MAVAALKLLYESDLDTEARLFGVFGQTSSKQKKISSEQEQLNRARKLFAAVVLTALNDAIADDKEYGNGPEQIARWARSRDGREVLSSAGIDPNERVVAGLMEFVSRGVRTSVALSREEEVRQEKVKEKSGSSSEPDKDELGLSGDEWIEAETYVLLAQAKSLSASIEASTGYIISRCEDLVRGYDGRN